MTDLNNTQAAWEELEILQSCREAISELLIPEPDLHVVNRNSLSLLLSYLDERERKAVANLRQRLN
jgi:hypothetical protein